MTCILKQLAGGRTYDVSRNLEWMEFLLLSATALLVPLIFRHPQIIVGSAVNFILIMAAINTRGWRKLLSLILLPGISATAGGYLFGGLTVFLLYLLPFIWLGNGALVLLFKWLFVIHKRNYFVSLFLSSLAKAACIFIPAYILAQFDILPGLFLYFMGPLQIVTALIGGLCVLPILPLYKNALHQTTNER